MFLDSNNQRKVLNMKILVIDDDAVWAATLSLQLQSIDPAFEVTEATSGLYVMQSDWSTISAFDRIITDTRMPSASGIEVLQYLRTRGWKKPVLLMSSDPVTEKGFDLEEIPIIFPFAQFCLKEHVSAAVRDFLT